MLPQSKIRAEINAVAAAMKAAWTAYPLEIEIDNRHLTDYAAQKNPFLQIQLLNLRGEQLDLGDDPWTEQHGQILLSAVVRDGEGTTSVAALLDFAVGFFHLKDFETLRCRAASFGRPRQVNEWWHEPAVIPFWYQWK